MEKLKLGHLMRLWHLPDHIGDQLRIRAVSRKPSLFAHNEVWKKTKGPTKHQMSSPTAHARLKNEFIEDEKCHNLMSWLLNESESGMFIFL